ncbi:MAG: hypothetical protein QNJ29_07840 [Rhizobiaceae bacterium]|nr:hypothetical protein [Rhizobiaceae bacterium]
MTDPILIFLAIAVIIIAVAIVLSWVYRKTIIRDKKIQRAHERDADGLSAGVGTSIGIDADDH